MLNAHNPKSAEQMDRTELIYELSREAHPGLYQRMTNMPTALMASLLAYYRVDKRENANAIVTANKETKYGVNITYK